MNKKIKIFFVFAFIVLFLINFNACNKNETNDTMDKEKSIQKAEEVIYTCPMHPQIKQNKPGSCPICKMDLVPQQQNQQIKENNQQNTNQQNTNQQTHKHKSQEDKNYNYNENHQHIPYQHPTENIRSAIYSPLAVPTFVVKYLQISNSYETIGYTELSNSNLRKIYFNTPVWIEDTYGIFEGQYIKKGQKLLKIKSFEIEEVKKELSIAQKYGDKQMEKYILKKLEFLRRYSLGNFASDGIIVSPGDFIVVKKMVNEGSFVDKGQEVLILAEPKSFWIAAYIPFADLDKIPTDSIVLVENPLTKNLQITSIRQISFESDKESKTAKYLLYFPSEFPKVINLPLKIRFENYKTCLVVPYESVVNTGESIIVYKQIKPNYFMPVKIQIGQIFRDKEKRYYEVKGGLKEGDIIAHWGYFLLDSEARIRGEY